MLGQYRQGQTRGMSSPFGSVLTNLSGLRGVRCPRVVSYRCKNGRGEGPTVDLCLHVRVFVAFAVSSDLPAAWFFMPKTEEENRPKWFQEAVVRKPVALPEP